MSSSSLLDLKLSTGGSSGHSGGDGAAATSVFEFDFRSDGRVSALAADRMDAELDALDSENSLTDDVEETDFS